jgi:hypothetical protein
MRKKSNIKCINHTELDHFAKSLCKLCYDKQYRETHKAEVKNYMRSWQQKNKDAANAQKLAWAKANPEKVKETKKKYVSRNLHIYRAQCAKRHAAKMKRTPIWADLNKIKEFYLNCPEGMEVDHIIPLQGENISGLHVLENLQYLTPTQNRTKNNSFSMGEIKCN